MLRVDMGSFSSVVFLIFQSSDSSSSLRRFSWSLVLRIWTNSSRVMFFPARAVSSSLSSGLLDQRAEEVTEYESIEKGRDGVVFFKLVNLV